MNIWDDLKIQYKIGGVTEKLIYWNVALFALPYVIQGLLSLFSIDFPFLNIFSLSSDPMDLTWKPWSIFTYAFFHGGFFHLLFNLIVLHFVSQLFITFFTQKQLLSLYMLGALVAGFFFLVSYLIFPRFSGTKIPLVGASGAVSAILFGVALYAPHMQIRLLLIGMVRLWHIAMVLFTLDLIRLSGANAGGHLAHIGGAFIGYIFAVQLKKGNDITGYMTATIDYLSNIFKPKPKIPFKKVHKNSAVTSVNVKQKDKKQQQIDEILDKISKSGYDSLSKDEKEFLFKSKD